MIKHPFVFIFVWLFMGYLGMYWGLETVTNWMIFTAGSIYIYKIVSILSDDREV